MSPRQEISKIDRRIDDLYAKMQALETIAPMSAESWQAAWDAHPDLAALHSELYHQRGQAQQRRDLSDWEAAKVEARKTRRKQAKYVPKKCPACQQPVYS